MAMKSQNTDAAPMMDINTTPLIDVMLVLLIMFILTIPMQNHAVKLDTPSARTPSKMPLPDKNEVAVTNADRVLWNGTPVDLGALRAYLDQSQMLDPIPELRIRPAADAGVRSTGALPCAASLSARIAASSMPLVAAHGSTFLGFAGGSPPRSFQNASPPPSKATTTATTTMRLRFGSIARPS